MPSPISPAHTDALLCDFLDPALTLPDIADKNRLSMQQLLAWADDHAADLERLATLSECRSRLLASHHAITALQSLSTVMKEHRAIADAPMPTDHKELALRHRQAEAARRAAVSILRAAEPPRRPSQKNPSSNTATDAAALHQLLESCIHPDQQHARLEALFGTRNPSPAAMLAAANGHGPDRA
jgi:hypothetical protein